jgi:hypothetical protein
MNDVNLPADAILSLLTQIRLTPNLDHPSWRVRQYLLLDKITDSRTADLRLHDQYSSDYFSDQYSK